VRPRVLITGSGVQVLITCLFPDTPRAANALISFNNQKAQKAVPGESPGVVSLGPPPHGLVCGTGEIRMPDA
jgi:hypothetical protein